MLFFSLNESLGNPPAWHRGLPDPSRPGTPKESEKSPKGCPGASGAGEPQSPQRVRPGVRKESKNAASDSFWTLFGPRGALFGDTLLDSFGLFWGSGPKGPGALCARRGFLRLVFLGNISFFLSYNGHLWTILELQRI